MKNVTIGMVICMLLVGLAPVYAGETENIFKFLLRANGCDENQRLGPAFWGIVPNTKNADVAVGLLGVCYNAQLVKVGEGTMKPAWNLEVLGGAIFTPIRDIPMLDVRLDLPMHGKKISAWLNAEWIDPGRDDSFYFYGMLVYPATWGAIGIETENDLGLSGSDDLALGPVAVVPVSDRLTAVVSYQFRTGDNPDRIWFRVVVGI